MAAAQPALAFPGCHRFRAWRAIAISVKYLNAFKQW